MKQKWSAKFYSKNKKILNKKISISQSYRRKYYWMKNIDLNFKKKKKK